MKMGAVDFLKDIQGKVVDAATYQLLERNFRLQADNNKLLAEKADLLQHTVDSQGQLITTLEKENGELRRKVEANQKVEEFRTYKSMDFKRKPSGKFSDQPYCPHCHKLMSVMEGFIVSCRPCHHTVTLQSERLPEIAKWLDENPE
jgi:hypothetical protein